MVGVGVKNCGSTIQFTAMYYLWVVASPVFFERNGQHLKSLKITLLILKMTLGGLFGYKKGKWYRCMRTSLSI